MSKEKKCKVCERITKLGLSKDLCGWCSLEQYEMVIVDKEIEERWKNVSPSVKKSVLNILRENMSEVNQKIEKENETRNQ